MSSSYLKKSDINPSYISNNSGGFNRKDQISLKMAEFLVICGAFSTRFNFLRKLAQTRQKSCGNKVTPGYRVLC